MVNQPQLAMIRHPVTDQRSMDLSIVETITNVINTLSLLLQNRIKKEAADVELIITAK